MLNPVFSTAHMRQMGMNSNYVPVNPQDSLSYSSDVCRRFEQGMFYLCGTEDLSTQPSLALSNF